MMANMALVQPRAANIHANIPNNAPMVSLPKAPMLPMTASRAVTSTSMPHRSRAVRVKTMESHTKGPLSSNSFLESALQPDFEFGKACPSPNHFEESLKASHEMLRAMSTKEYQYEDPSKDLEKLIHLVEDPTAVFILDDILAVVKNAVSCATKKFRKVTTAIRAAEVLSLFPEPSSEEIAAKLRAATNYVANGIDSAVQMDRKAVNHFEVVAFFVAAERACPTVSKILIRRRCIAFAGRFKELVSYVDRRGMKPNQAATLFCALSKLAENNRLETSSRDITFLASKIEDGGCSKLSAKDMQAVAYHARHTISSLQVYSMLQGIGMEVIHRAAFNVNPVSTRKYESILNTLLRSCHLLGGRPAAVKFKNEIKKWKKEQESAAEAAKEKEMMEMAYSFAACTVLAFLNAAKYYPSA